MPDPIASYLIDDVYAPTVPKPSLQQYDNYQTYSIVCCDYPVEITYLHKSRIDGGIVDRAPTYFYYYTAKDFDNSNAFSYNTSGEAEHAIAYQRFSASIIPIEFSNIAQKLNVKPNDYYGYKYRTSIEKLDIYTDDLSNGSPTVVDLDTLWSLDSNTGDSHDINPYNYASLTYFETFPRLGQTGNSTRSRTFQHLRDTTVTVNLQIPRLDMFAAIGGYSGDPRIGAINYPLITPVRNSKISISYYRYNPDEPIPDITSLDWHTYYVDLIKGQSIHLPIASPVFGSLVFDGDSEIISDIKSQLVEPASNRYQWADYYAENIDSIVNDWKSIYSSFPSQSPAPASLNPFGKHYLVYSQPIQRVIAANNNYWGNDFNTYSDINFNQLHRLFIVNNYRAFDWHIKPQVDGSYGNLVMNSPKIDEIHKALNAGKYAINEIDNTKQRVTDLGFLVERIAKVLGIRFDANGKIDIPKEKSIVRQVVPSKNKIDKKKIGVNCFGDEGIVVQRINNRFKNKDDIVSDQCVILQDIPQMIQEYFEQSNLALGLQESSAIEIKHGDTKARFNNQLELLVELVNLASSGNEMIRSALVSSLISQSQTNEIIAGIGLPSVTKTIPIKIDKKVHQLPYKGIAAHRSLSQEIATCTYNVGIATGQLL